MSGAIYHELRSLLLAGEPVSLVSVTRVGDEVGGTTVLAAKLLVRANEPVLGTLGDAELDRVVGRDALAMLERGVSGTRHYGAHGEARREEIEVFVEAFVAPPRMIVFGAVDFSRALVEVAKVLGFVVTVCDARPVFATSKRWPRSSGPTRGPSSPLRQGR